MCHTAPGATEVKVPTGFCHGDLTFSNMMMSDKILLIDFLDDFSRELKSNKKIYKFPDLIYLVFWTSYKKIGEAKKKFLSKNMVHSQIQKTPVTPFQMKEVYYPDWVAILS